MKPIKILYIALIASLVGCAPSETTDTLTATRSALETDASPPITVSVSPNAATVQLGTDFQFSATVTNAQDTSVVWSILESPGCGTISSSGLYSAPTSARSPCHVVATSNQDPSKSDSAGITMSSGNGMSSGCGLTGMRTGTFHVATRDGNAVRRDFMVVVPATYNPTVPLDLTFVYHGLNQNEAIAASWGVQDTPGAANASIFVFPQGRQVGTDGIGWDDSCGGRDMPFFDHMMSILESSYCINTQKIFAAGFSWGCDQTVALSCCRGDVIRAVGAASCSYAFNDPSDYTTYMNLTCPTATDAAYRFTHDSNSDGAYTLQQFQSTSALMRSFNSCAATATPTSPSPCVSYDTCAHPVVECAYPSLGHQLPSGWGADTWNFFNSL